MTRHTVNTDLRNDIIYNLYFIIYNIIYSEKM